MRSVGSPRHAALVSDLIEPLRTFLVDPFHSQLIRTGQISSAKHFQPQDSGVYLNDSGRQRATLGGARSAGEELRYRSG
jgi:CRISPR-associated protein Cas1